MMAKNIKLITLGVLLTNTLLGQTEVLNSTKSNSIYQWIFDNFLLVLGGLVIIGAFFTLLSLVNKLLDLQKIRLLDEHGKAALDEIKLTSSDSTWTSIYNKLQGWRPIEKESDILIDHEYDGIRELDNNLPPWWLYLFYGTIIFGVFYMYVYQMSDIGSGQIQSYEIEMEYAAEQKAMMLDRQSNMVNESNVTMLTDDSSITKGEGIYKKNCLACHAAQGQGLVGPNLTDEYWLHGGGIKDVFATIKYGVPEKGMIAWQAQLNASDMHAVASYIMTLSGTNPPNPKAPEGNLYVEVTNE